MIFGLLADAFVPPAFKNESDFFKQTEILDELARTVKKQLTEFPSKKQLIILVDICP